MSGFYLRDEDGTYYVADAKQNVADIEVTERPFYTCTWNSGTEEWEYDLEAARNHQKRIINFDCYANVLALLLANNMSLFDILSIALMRRDIDAYVDNPANPTPFLTGYSGATGDSIATSVTDLTPGSNFCFAAFGQIYGYRQSLFDDIDAAASGVAILAITYTPFE